MKVRCIDSYYYSCIDINLTNDKIYEVLNVYESKYSKTCYYYIKNDDGVVNYYGKERFEEVKTASDVDAQIKEANEAMKEANMALKEANKVLREIWNSLKDKGIKEALEEVDEE